jgi:GNAT superfamily N-acetyltransferase
MISLTIADRVAEFETAAALCRALGAWDAEEVAAYGVDPQLVISLYHRETAETLASKYGLAGAGLFIARWQGTPAGCLAFNSFDAASAELHKFYVDTRFRGSGIGRALMHAVLAEIEKTGRRRILIHTTVYMSSAIAVYEAFGFRRCDAFRAVSPDVAHTEIFMARTAALQPVS